MTALTNIGGWEYQSFWQQTNPSVMMPQALLTKFHQQGQQDPQRDLKGLPDVVIVEGEDGESLFVGSWVSVIVGVLVRRQGWISPRRVASRDSTRNEQEQQNAR